MSDLISAYTSDPLNRTQDQLDDDLRCVAEMYTTGFALAEIADKMQAAGREYTEQDARADLVLVRARWASAAPASGMAVTQEELAANEALLVNAWRNYRVAQEAVAKAPYPDDEDDNSEEATGYGEDVPHRKLVSWRKVRLQARAQAFTEQRMWWETILKLREQRAKLLGLAGGEGINVNVDNRSVVMPSGEVRRIPPIVYVGFSPNEWDEIVGVGADVIDGQVEE